MIHSINETSVREYISLVREINRGDKKYAHVITFGCQQNERDSETVLGLLGEMGYEPTDNPDMADIVVINTCAIREHAEVKALSLLGRFKALKKKKPDLIVGVVGCMAAEPHRADMLKKDFHYVSFTLEPNMLHRIPELVYKKLRDGKRSFIFGEDEGDIYEDAPAVRRDKHRAWVSIMYGCNNFCSYCIVPYVRGRERSRRSEDIIDECKTLVASGVKEITLLGQNVNSYKSDITFPMLLGRIAEINGDFIIRFMTSHPKDTSDELISVMKRYTPKIAPFFHLPLQSGSNRILKEMNRTYSRERYLEIVAKLKSSIPSIALSTDIIIGFPTETEEDFADTMDIIRSVEFDNVYAFLYSPREGTRAAKMEGTVDREVKDSRMAELLKLQDKLSLDRNLPYENTTQRVLVDSFGYRNGERICCGRTLTNKLVYFPSDVDAGEFTKVKIIKACPYHLLGEAERRG
ncbi:MAG: tRNA (N6-isopentenyl adenosine(37)-C2)-methylthiotransferase MiaB [Clostridia bacterium]|nr:tRNA (N6-isopentenyl adenosine(37)-C2)-methylthiotransferase MiaB [Clostridia bacterium]